MYPFKIDTLLVNFTYVISVDILPQLSILQNDHEKTAEKLAKYMSMPSI